MEDPDGFLNVSLLDFQGDVDQQVASLLEHVRLSRGDVVGLRNLLADLESALRNIWPGCEVHPFGSIVTGLGIKSSDVDVYVRMPHSQLNRLNPVIMARNKLRSKPWIFTKVFAIPSAKVPIVKFLHIPTGSNCDVNFHSESGVRNSKLIFHLLRTDPKALSLAILVKYWSKVFAFTGTNLLPNYALTMLVIFYLQQVNMLAPIAELQQYVDPYFVEGWNTAFNKNIPQPNACSDHIYHLLGGFFKYYSVFRFDQHVVSTFLGYPVPRIIFGSPDQVPHNEFSLYKENLRGEFCKPLRIDTLMCIQDPFDHSRNCAVAISQKLFAKIQAHFQYAARMYEDVPPDDFLKALLTQDNLYSTRVTIGTMHKRAKRAIFKNNTRKNKRKMNSAAKTYVEMQKSLKKGNNV
ncbi:U6 snRNA-specific terminal uridylyltransferase 1 [Operophtera brumata]|uniref:U6 snRNA-specific terminal uridylyltransferase 1 n=1 Tax=Operophtera brumata TaxID=104452 RepID=A0A0L7LVB9_OPEBR|nr:U6 snRNA-specific terminal uridylyltransferase 1 [Operophtera brumata]